MHLLSCWATANDPGAAADRTHRRRPSGAAAVPTLAEVVPLARLAERNPGSQGNTVAVAILRPTARR